MNSLISLAQLAVDSGGRFTENTNDFSLGYARAQRDLSCLYSVGFYDHDSVDDRPGNVTVRVRQKGLHALHPGKYMFRSEPEKRASLVKAAWAAPDMFQTGLVRAHIFPSRPASRSEWESLLAVSFPIALEGSGGKTVERDFGAVLTRKTSTGSRVIHRFDRRITMTPEHAAVASEPTVTFLEPVRVPPGDYVLTVMTLDTDGSRPDTATIELQMPEVPLSEPFLIGPMLGRRAGADVVIVGGESDAVGGQASFRPLLVQQTDEPVDLVALSQACVVGSRRAHRRHDGSSSLARTLTDRQGEAVGQLQVQTLELEGDGPVRCQNLVDLMPAAAMRQGEYVFDVELRSAKGQPVDRASVRFAVSQGTTGR